MSKEPSMWPTPGGASSKRLAAAVREEQSRCVGCSRPHEPQSVAELEATLRSGGLCPSCRTATAGPPVFVSLLNEDGAEVTERVEARDQRDVFELSEAAKAVSWAEFSADGRLVEQGELTEPYELAAGARVRMHEDHLGDVRLVPEMGIAVVEVAP